MIIVKVSIRARDVEQVRASSPTNFGRALAEAKAQGWKGPKPAETPVRIETTLDPRYRLAVYEFPEH